MDELKIVLDASTAYVEQITKAQAAFQANSEARGAVGKHVSALSEQLKFVEDALQRVQGISRQVTILATNATIEAAHAGAQGKGFAVVAEEVGNLARNTAGAVSDIGENLTQMKALLRETVQDMETAKAVGGSFDETLDACVQDAKGLHALIGRAGEEEAEVG